MTKPFWDKSAPAAATPASSAAFFDEATKASATAPTAAQARVIAQKKCPIHGTQMVPHGPSAFKCTVTGCTMIIN